MSQNPPYVQIFDKEIPTQNLRVIIADDHKIFRSGLYDFLAEIPFVSKITAVEDGKQAIDLLAHEHYDVVMMDIEMPVMDGVEATRIIRRRFPNVKVVALTMFVKEAYIMDLYYADVSGYLLKDTDLGELMRALNAVRHNEQYYCKPAAEVLYENLLRPANTERDHKVFITSREKEVLKLICDQYSSEEIAEKLFISIKTVKRHRQILLDKTNSKNLAGLVVFSIRNGIYDVQRGVSENMRPPNNS